MQNLNDLFGPPKINRNIHNTGGPYSKVRNEEIDLSFFKEVPEAEADEMEIRLTVPPKVTPEKFIRDLLKKTGFESIGAFEVHRPPPPHTGIAARMATVPGKKPPIPRKPEEKLYQALILARTSGNAYVPHRTPVFTRGRLNAHLKLNLINMEGFYEVAG